MSEGMQLEAQVPDELRSLMDGDLIPELGVRVGLRFLFALTKYPNRSVGSRRLSELRVCRHFVRFYHMHLQ
jgi:hypothetical protein